MSLVYYAYHHVYNADGRNKLIHEHEYGPLALTGKELMEFLDDFEEVHEFEKKLYLNGEFEMMSIIETYEYNGTHYTINAGRRLTFPKCDPSITDWREYRDLYFHPAYFKWEVVMRRDPRVVVIDAVWKENDDVETTDKV